MAARFCICVGRCARLRLLYIHGSHCTVSRFSVAVVTHVNTVPFEIYLIFARSNLTERTSV